MTSRTMPAFCGCLARLLLASSCSQQTPADTRAAGESAIRELDAQWSKTAAANDLEGTVSFYSDDATLLPPNAPIATGKQAIRASWAALLGPGVSVSWQVSKIEVSRSGDLGYLIGVYSLNDERSARQTGNRPWQACRGVEKGARRKVEDRGRHL